MIFTCLPSQLAQKNMKRRNENRYSTLCLLLLVLPQVLLPTSAKSFSQKEGEGEEQNLPRNDDEWRKLCEDAREVCDECKDMALECLKVENCRREGEDQAQEDHLPSQACAGVQVNDSAVNSFCDYCGQNAETCQNLTTCEDSGGERGLLDRVNSMVNQCLNEGEKCERNNCCGYLKCRSDTAAGGQGRKTCQYDAPQQQKPEQPCGNGKPEKPCGCQQPGTTIS